MVRPTCLVRYADAGELFVSWRWADALHEPGASMTPHDAVDEAIAALTAALPGASDLAGPLTTGAFAAYDTEIALSRQLTRALLPPGLAQQLDAMHERGVHPHLRIQPSPRTAQVPWELLAADPEDVRLIDFTDISVLAPATLVHDPSREPRPWSATRERPVVAVVDPRVPGFTADSRLGSVLGRMSADAPLAEHLAAYGDRLRPAVTDPAALFRRTDTDRAWLRAALAEGASRLLYVGHATAAPPESGEGEHAQLHLACTADTEGHAPPVRTHRPLSAKDMLLGAYAMPSRVALIACESGGDLRFAETLGLASAMILGGAELVTATRWTLPTDLAVQRIAGGDARPLRATIAAIDAAHESDDAVHAMSDWQRERLAAWRAGAAPADSPVLWGAFATIDTSSAV